MVIALSLRVPPQTNAPSRCRAGIRFPGTTQRRVRRYGHISKHRCSRLAHPQRVARYPLVPETIACPALRCHRRQDPLLQPPEVDCLPFDLWVPRASWLSSYLIECVPWPLPASIMFDSPFRRLGVSTARVFCRSFLHPILVVEFFRTRRQPSLDRWRISGKYELSLLAIEGMLKEG